ncbi:MAG: Lipoprotein LpqB, GerMN domain protein [Eubacterium sp.]|nr:Lipoprotein LpqB, GerMN domain protein [Eubacterium sp.]
MKRFVFVLCILGLTLSCFTGCQKKDRNQAINTSPDSAINTNAPNTTNTANTTSVATSSLTPAPALDNLKIKDYFPLQNDVEYVYIGSGNEYASYNVYIDYIRDTKVQQRINNGGTETVKVFEIKNGQLTMLSSKSEVYYRENFLEATGGESEVYLKEPLVVGNTWNLKNSKKRTITNIDVDITTSMGGYKAIEVTLDTPEGKTLEYYVKDIGLVKTIYKSGELEVSSTLDKIKKNVAYTSVIDFYYPVKESEKLHYSSKSIGFKTNDKTHKVLEEAYKNIAVQKQEKPLLNDVQINILYLNIDKIVYIDLNSAFIAEINKQKQYEKAILQSIANTFGGYYNSEKVILTIDNKAYKSDNISMKKGEYLKVNLLGNIRDKE